MAKSDQLKSAVSASDKLRDSARPHGGSLGATMNQGGVQSHSSAATLAELLDQGGSTKRGGDKMGSLRSKMLQ